MRLFFFPFLVSTTCFIWWAGQEPSFLQEMHFLVDYNTITPSNPQLVLLNTFLPNQYLDTNLNHTENYVTLDIAGQKGILNC